MWGGPDDDGVTCWDGTTFIPEGVAYVTKDSGEKAVHSDGVQRDRQHGKTKFTLMFPRGVPMKDQLLVRIAELYTRGGEKYGDRNWENSCAPDTLDHHLEALWRHFMSFFFEENQEEDHAAAIVWNINAVELTRRNIRKAEEHELTKTRAAILTGESEKLIEAYEAREASPELLAVRDDSGDYWKPNDDGTFNCWPQGSEPNDSMCGWTLEDIRYDGEPRFVYERPEAGFPWE